jgi:hypothetical protein
MSITEIENELKKMTDSERSVVIEIATKLIHRDSHTKVGVSLAEKRAQLKRSAEIMLPEYKTDNELTGLTVLDGEDFLDA